MAGKYKYNNLIVKKSKNLPIVLFRWIIIIGISYVILYPIFVKIAVAFMSESDMYDMTVKWIPNNITIENFKKVFEYVDYGAYFFQTLFISVTSMLLQLASCILSAYAFARFKFKGRIFLMLCVLLTLVIPRDAYMVTTYMQYRFFDFFGLLKIFGIESIGSLINTPIPSWIMSIGCQALKNGLFIFVLFQCFKGLPKELEEAAWVDGAGVFKTFYRIMLPNAVPAITTVSMLSFVWTWNDLYMASTYMPKMKLFPMLLNTISSTLQRASGGASAINTIELSMLTNAAVLLIILPLIILFVFCQKLFVQGVERSGITGM